MHTLETAVLLPMILLVFAAGIGLSFYTVRLMEKRTAVCGENDNAGDSLRNADVLRIVQVVYETVSDAARS